MFNDAYIASFSRNDDNGADWVISIFLFLNLALHS